jgi:hypothetical protein
MVHIRRTTRKSTGGHFTVRRLAPRGTPRQREEPVEPQQEEPIEPQQEEFPEPQEEEPVELEEDAIHS